MKWTAWHELRIPHWPEHYTYLQIQHKYIVLKSQIKAYGLPISIPLIQMILSCC